VNDLPIPGPKGAYELLIIESKPDQLIDASRELVRYLPFEGQVGGTVRVSAKFEAAIVRFRKVLAETQAVRA
jgi:hypothetical protein